MENLRTEETVDLGGTGDHVLYDVLSERTAASVTDVLDGLTAEEVALLRHRAEHDALTGLPNRDLFRRRLERHVRVVNEEGGDIGVLMIDLDRFKPINDCYGHLVGDSVLVQIAERLRSVIRGQDTVARFGGDEFAVVCSAPRTSDIVALGERIREALRVPLVIEGRRLVTGGSVGIALGPDDPDALLREADRALYEAKARGRDQVVVFDHVERRRASLREARVADLRTAIAAGDLSLAYQPVIDLASGVCVGLEALCRWTHPLHGSIPPDVFVPLAERHGMSMDLGRHVLDVACGQLLRWPEAVGAAAMEMAVNVSPLQFAYPTLAGSIETSLEVAGLDPSRLCVEITESTLMGDVDRAIGVLEELRRLGVKVAIDDFGTGYSSLSYLRRFPVDFVKIDRSFVAEMTEDPSAEAIVASIVTLSHALGSEVIAEGIETEEQLAAVVALGVDRAQGYWWSAPCTFDDAATWDLGRRDHVGRLGEVDVAGLLGSLVDSHRHATGRNLLLHIEARFQDVDADALVMRRVVERILTNATTYSVPPAPVVLSATADRRWIRVSISDFGVGMSRSQSSRCFEQFWQAGPRTSSGVGIGLYEARSLVEQVGGHIGVRSAPGKGSTFTVAFPRGPRGDAQKRRATTGRRRRGADSSIREFMRQLGVPERSDR